MDKLATQSARRIVVLGGAVGLAAFGLVAAAVLGIGSDQAAARPEYAQKEGKACGYCHVSPAGGGALNSRGQKYQKNGHKF